MRSISAPRLESGIRARCTTPSAWAAGEWRGFRCRRRGNGCSNGSLMELYWTPLSEAERGTLGGLECRLTPGGHRAAIGSAAARRFAEGKLRRRPRNRRRRGEAASAPPAVDGLASEETPSARGLAAQRRTVCVAGMRLYYCESGVVQFAGEPVDGTPSRELINL